MLPLNELVLSPSLCLGEVSTRPSPWGEHTAWVYTGTASSLSGFTLRQAGGEYLRCRGKLSGSSGESEKTNWLMWQCSGLIQDLSGGGKLQGARVSHQWSKLQCNTDSKLLGFMRSYDKRSVKYHPLCRERFSVDYWHLTIDYCIIRPNTLQLWFNS